MRVGHGRKAGLGCFLPMSGLRCKARPHPTSRLACPPPAESDASATCGLRVPRRECRMPCQAGYAEIYKALSGPLLRG